MVWEIHAFVLNPMRNQTSVYILQTYPRLYSSLQSHSVPLMLRPCYRWSVTYWIHPKFLYQTQFMCGSNIFLFAIFIIFLLAVIFCRFSTASIEDNMYISVSSITEILDLLNFLLLTMSFIWFLVRPSGDSNFYTCECFYAWWNTVPPIIIWAQKLANNFPWAAKTHKIKILVKSFSNILWNLMFWMSFLGDAVNKSYIL